MKATQEFLAIKDKANPITQMLNDRKLRTAYNTQYRNSQRRGIEFRLSYEEWLTVWLYSGKLHLRGKYAGCYAMGRKGDKGAYEVGNVEIISIEQNTHDGHIGKKKSASHRRKLANNLKKNRKYVRVMVDGKHFNSLTECAKYFNTSVQCVNQRCKSKSARFSGWKIVGVVRGQAKANQTNNIIHFPTKTVADMDLSVDLSMENFDPIDYAALARGEL